MENLIVWVYIIYILFIAVSTIYVARTLFSKGKTYMAVIFGGREELANSTNKLFETGFFLLAFGLGLICMKAYYYGTMDYKAFFEVLSYKTGWYTLFLGILLFFNLFLFFRGMKHRRRETQIQ